jgi:biopolymer transport protein ExbD/biopolymer transport protein TolR
MAVNVGSTTDVNSEINVTPMADVMLVLLIIFMVITPMLQQGVTVTLPRGDNPDEEADIIKDTAVVISIPAEGLFYVGRDPIQGTDKLIETIKTRMEQRKEGDPKVVYIKGGTNVQYGEIVSVIKSIYDAGYQNIGLVAEKRKTGEQ